MKLTTAKVLAMCLLSLLSSASLCPATPEQMESLKIITREHWGKIDAPEDAQYIGGSDEFIDPNWIIKSNYSTQMDFESVRDHYIAEFEANGWTPQESSDSSLQQISYCMGTFGGTVEYVEVPNRGAAFTFTVRSRVGECLE